MIGESPFYFHTLPPQPDSKDECDVDKAEFSRELAAMATYYVNAQLLESFVERVSMDAFKRILTKDDILNCKGLTKQHLKRLWNYIETFGYVMRCVEDAQKAQV